MGIKNFIKKLIELFTVPRCPNCGAKLEEVPREEESDPIAFKCINCALFFVPILGHVLFVIFIIRFVHLLKYLYGKEE